MMPIVSPILSYAFLALMVAGFGCGSAKERSESVVTNVEKSVSKHLHVKLNTTNGVVWNFDEQPQKRRLIYILDSWCDACKTHVRQIESERYHGQKSAHFEMVAIWMDGDSEQSRTLIDNSLGQLDVIQLYGSPTLAASLRSENLFSAGPTIILLDSTGRVRERFEGFTPSSYVIRKLENLGRGEK